MLMCYSFRLSADVQDFKSSFKLVVSQGLRGITQSIGCMVSLFLISPQMTGVVGMAVPVMIAMGTLMGVGLRVWSREAQAQVGVVNSVLANNISILRNS